MSNARPLTIEDARERLSSAFQWMESWDLRVSRVWLNPGDVRTIKPLIDPVSSLHVQRHVSAEVGAFFVGHCWGALLFSSPLVPVGHVALAPDGMEARLIDSSAARLL